MSPHRFGIFAELSAIILLILKGYRILSWRHKTPFGEIDIIAKRFAVIAIVEVKARKSSKLAIDGVLMPKQIDRIQEAAQFFMNRNPKLRNMSVSLDFIEVNSFLLPRHHVNFIV